MGRACNMYGRKRNGYMFLSGKAEGKKPLGTSRCRWMDNIRKDLREIDFIDRILLCI
jgi:hypothetical protein